MIKISRNKGLKYFIYCVMNLNNIWVSLSEMSDKNIDLFPDIHFFLDVPVEIIVKKRQYMFYSIIIVFTVPFDQFDASLLKKVLIYFYKIYYFANIIFTACQWMNIEYSIFLSEFGFVYILLM